MAMQELTLAALMEQLDGGRVGVTFAKHVSKMVLDLEDRPNVAKPRKIVLEFECKPVMDPDTKELADVMGQFVVKSAFPVQKSRVYGFAARRKITDGGAAQMTLIFNDMADDNVQQRTLDEME